MRRRTLACSVAITLALGCASVRPEPAPEPEPGPTTEAPRLSAEEATAADIGNPFPSTYEPIPSPPTLIRNATIMTATGRTLRHASLLMRDGEIAAIGHGLTVPEGTQVIDATGAWVTPGLIDTHSHLGVYAAPSVPALADGNEMTDPNTAGVWAEHSIWPQDPQFALALAGGVTTLQILPGSANLFGGRGVTVKNVPSVTVQGMKFPDAPYSLKMACGENPKRVYGSRGQFPSTRMGNFAGYRRAFINAREYLEEWRAWYAGEREEKPKRNLKLETLAGVLEGEILVHMHCYRADEMAYIIDLAQQFGYEIASFHHAVEAYKIADLLAEHEICVSTWADWWGFKVEAFDAIQQNAALVDAAGGCAIIHSDSPEGIQRLNQAAAKALEAARSMGMEQITREDALQWITINPARALGIAERVGSLEVGKNADVVIWSGDPFSVYTKAMKVFIDGALVYDRTDPQFQPVSDFELGNLPAEGTQP